MRHRVNKCNGDFASTIRLWGSAIIVGKREIAVRAGSDLANRAKSLIFRDRPALYWAEPLASSDGPNCCSGCLGYFRYDTQFSFGRRLIRLRRERYEAPETKGFLTD